MTSRTEIPQPEGRPGDASPSPRSEKRRGEADARRKSGRGSGSRPRAGSRADGRHEGESRRGGGPLDRETSTEAPPHKESSGKKAGKSTEGTPPGRDRPSAAATGEPSPRTPRKPRNKFYAYVTPVPAAEPGSVWTQLRRFVAADLSVRLRRFQVKDVLLPIGFSFWGDDLPDAALRSRVDPFELGAANARALMDLLARLRIELIPGRAVEDRDPAYYRWTQWLFLRLFRRQLLSCSLPGILGSVPGPMDLGADEVSSERRKRPEDRRRLWMLELGEYGDRLTNDLGKAGWPATEKANQRHRLGRRRGCELIFQATHHLRMEVDELHVFTPRVETIYGCTFLLVHPWHPILEAVVEPGYEEDVQFYRERVLRNQEPRLSGVRTGGFAINPASLRRIPILVSRLAMEPETGGTILGVPAHDPLLYELAQRVRLPIREVVRGEGSDYDVRGNLQAAFVGDGKLTNSGVFSGVPARTARDRIIQFLARRGICRRATRFFYDHVPVSARSIWGVPVPLVHCDACGVVPVSESDLPVVAPAVRLQHLEQAREAASRGERERLDLGLFKRFVPTACPSCGASARRDTQVIASWLGEAWMFLRHPLPELGGDVEGVRSAGLPGTADDDSAAEEIDSVVARVASLEDLDELMLFGDRAPGPAPGADEGSGVEAEADVEGELEDVGPAPDPAPEPPAGAPTSASEASEESVAAAAQGAGASAVVSETPASAAAAPAEGPTPAAEAAVEEPTPAEAPAPPAAPRPLQPFRGDRIRKWLSVDLAISHAGRGTLYDLNSRFLTKFLYDVREISFYEPFYRFYRSGPVAAPVPGAVVPNADSTAAPAELDPRDLIARYGADAVRLALLAPTSFLRPMRLSEHDVFTKRRFLDRVRRQVELRLEHGKFVSRRVLVAKHELIRAISDNVRRIRFHHAVTAFHVYLQFLEDPQTQLEEMDRTSLQAFLILLYPFAPELASELWPRTGSDAPIESQEWQEPSEELLRPIQVEVPVLVDNRLVQRLRVEAGLGEGPLRDRAIDDEKVIAATAGRTIARVIVVPGRIVNILCESPSVPQ